MNPIVQWLESPAGEEWSWNFHRGQSDGGVPTRHSNGVFASIKYDHENCNWNPIIDDYIACGPSSSSFSWTDRMIREEIDKYGMNGVP